MSVEKKAPLEDLMAAMDVVDTLRHQQGLVERELDAGGRRERLLARLRELYQAQGIEVTDTILQEGITALEEERFKYKPVASSFATRVAHIWVSRGRWAKPVGFLTVLASLFFAVYVVKDVLPERALRNGLPVQLQNSFNSIESVAQNPAVVSQARQKLSLAEQALESENYATAQQTLNDLQAVNESLQLSYSIRIVSAPNQNSGVWRVPDINESGRNYYLIVEAVDANNDVIALPVLSEETNKLATKKQWGLRVNKQTFDRIASDKRDDGIIQSNQVGEKKVGFLQPEFSIATTGGTITEW
ncbi:DUF6384 family protein [Arenicella sp.]|nr:DUF6384 family protein [Arenicella sp.]